MAFGKARKGKIDTSKIDATDIDFEEADAGKKQPGANSFTDEKNFTFQDPPTADESRLNTKITTNNEHQNKQDKNTDPEPGTQDNSTDPSEEDTTGNTNDPGGSDPGGFDPGPDIDEMPEGHDKEEADMFDVEDEPEDENKLDFKKLQPPADFPDWSAEKKANWIVDIREILAKFILGRFSKVSTYYVKTQGRKYVVPKDILDKVLKDYEQYNEHVDNAISLPPFYKKILKHLWTQVLRESPGFAKKNTPLFALITTELTFLAMQIDEMQRAKKFGLDMMAFHKDLFEQYYELNKEHSKKTAS